MIKELPLGLRLNNPFNIEHDGKTVWRGQSADQPDPSFVKFDDAVAGGLRAGFRILLNYLKKDIHTIPTILNRWAPPSENDTDAYVKDVCTRCDIPPAAVVSISDLPVVAPAMVHHEQGQDPFTAAQYQEALRLAQE
jgi:hypothetical protein